MRVASNVSASLPLILSVVAAVTTTAFGGAGGCSDFKEEASCQDDASCRWSFKRGTCVLIPNSCSKLTSRRLCNNSPSQCSWSATTKECGPIGGEPLLAGPLAPWPLPTTSPAAACPSFTSGRACKSSGCMWNKKKTVCKEPTPCKKLRVKKKCRKASSRCSWSGNACLDAASLLAAATAAPAMPFTTETDAAVDAGATTLVLMDVTGINVGDTAEVGSGGAEYSETSTVALVTAGVRRATAGAVTLTDALQNGHVAGTRVTFTAAPAAAAAADDSSANVNGAFDSSSTFDEEDEEEKEEEETAAAATSNPRHPDFALVGFGGCRSDGNENLESLAILSHFDTPSIESCGDRCLATPGCTGFEWVDAPSSHNSNQEVLKNPWEFVAYGDLAYGGPDCMLFFCKLEDTAGSALSGRRSILPVSLRLHSAHQNLC